MLSVLVISAWACAPSHAYDVERLAVTDVVAAWKQTDALFFESDSMVMHYFRPPGEDVRPSAAMGHVGAEWTIAYRGDKWLTERRFTEPVRTPDLYIPAEPMREVVNHNLILEWTQDNHRAVLDEFCEGRNIYSGFDYTLYMSLDAAHRITTSNGAGQRLGEIRRMNRYVADLDRPFLPAFLEQNKSHYRVAPSTERFDGRPLWLVEWPGMDRMWVDPERGCAVVRRSYAWAPGKPTRVEVRCSDYREAKPGLWLPFTEEVDLYANVSADDEKLWGEVVTKLRYSVRSVEFDSLSDDFFDVKLPAGTTVLDIPRDLEYRIAVDGDDDPFASPIGEALRELAKADSTNWLLILNGVILIALALFFVYGRTRRSI